MSFGLTVHPIVRFSTAYSKKCLKCQDHRHRDDFMLLLTAVSMMFCSRLIQTSAVTFWIHQHS